MATPFEDFVNAELPARIVIIRGATDATGDPNASALPLVNAAPAGSFYQQDDTIPKTLWVKDAAGSTSWVELGEATGGGGGFISVETSTTDLETNFPAADNDLEFAIVKGLTDTTVDGIYRSVSSTWIQVLRTYHEPAFSKDVEPWDTDQATIPLPVIVPPFSADAFNGFLDTAIYADIPLGPLYDETKALTFKYMFQMDGPSTNEVEIDLDYQFFGASPVAPGESYTTISDDFTPDGTNTIRTREIVIPVQSGLGSNPMLTVKFTRNGSTDANNEDFNLISTQIYQV